MDTCVDGSCFCGAYRGTPCVGTSDSCTSGECKCGNGPPCSKNADTCDNGSCKCGKQDPCNGLTDTCLGGQCLCGKDGYFFGCNSETTDACIDGVCKCGSSDACTFPSTCINGTCTCLVDYANPGTAVTPNTGCTPLNPLCRYDDNNVPECVCGETDGSKCLSDFSNICVDSAGPGTCGCGSNPYCDPNSTTSSCLLPDGTPPTTDVENESPTCQVKLTFSYLRVLASMIFSIC